METCKTCEENKGKLIQFKEKKTVCHECRQEVDRVLDLHHTRADLCSLKCEASYWIGLSF